MAPSLQFPAVFYDSRDGHRPKCRGQERGNAEGRMKNAEIAAVGAVPGGREGGKAK